MKVAVQINKVPGEVISGVDRVYIGERFCVERYLKNLDEFTRYAESASTRVWLATPEMVAESVLVKTAAATLEAADCFEGVLVADPGLAMLLKGKCRLGFKGTILNTESAGRITEMLEVEHLRLYPPTLNTIEALAVSVKLEITVHGKLPLSSTPRCPTAGYRDCADCETERIVDGGPEKLLLRGNTIYAWRPISAFGLIDRFNRIGVEWAVIEALHPESETIEKLAAIYRGDTPAPDRKSSGIFYGNEANMSYLVGRRWMDLLETDEGLQRKTGV